MRKQIHKDQNLSVRGVRHGCEGGGQEMETDSGGREEICSVHGITEQPPTVTENRGGT